MSAGLSHEEIKKKTVRRSYTLMHSNPYCTTMFWHLLKGILDGGEWYLSNYRINSINNTNDVWKFCENWTSCCLVQFNTSRVLLL